MTSIDDIKRGKWRAIKEMVAEAIAHPMDGWDLVKDGQTSWTPQDDVKTRAEDDELYRRCRVAEKEILIELESFFQAKIA